MTNSISYNSNENKQGNFHGLQEMNTVRSTKQVISNVHALVGGALFGIGVFVFALHFFFDHSSAVLSLQITGGVQALAGVIELIISAFFRRSARRDQAKLAELKAEGLSFPAEITKIQRHLGVHFGRSFSAYAECSYKNHEGKTCLVKSQSFLYKNDNFNMLPYDATALGAANYSNYSAWVYVNPRNPQDYAVEVFTQAMEAQGGYDYR